MGKTASELVLAGTVNVAILNQNVITTVSECTASRTDFTIFDMNIYVIKSCNTVIARNQFTVVYFNITASPCMQSIVACYYSIESAAGRNDLLKEVIDHIEYEKTPENRGHIDNFTIRIYPKLK